MRWGEIQQTLRTALVGPQALAFLPALILGGYWFGGEGILLFAAFLVPGLLAALGAFGAPRQLAEVGAPDTRLPRREAAVAHLDTLLGSGPTRARMTACLSLGIDEVDLLIDRFGRRQCDDLMGIVGERLRAVTRGRDFVVRSGEFEFALVLSSAGRADLEILLRIANRLQNVVSEPVSLDGGRVYLTATVGFCLPGAAPGQAGLDMLEAAECAMAEGRAAGTAEVRAYSSDMQNRASTRAGLTAQVRQALESGQIVPWFQPQVDARTGTITGAEALARWHHPDQGVLAPGLFLPVIEEAGLTEALGRKILSLSLEHLKALDDAGLHLPHVSVNFSHEELRNPKLAEIVERELERHGVAPKRLQVEVLETVIASTRNDTVCRNLWGLSELGCTIALDDFGTGHAAIGNIRRFAVSCVKIDRSFIVGLDSDLEQQNLVSAMLTMADRLSLATVAEGVETADERAILARLGCGQIQGYGLARPMSAEALREWLQSYRPESVHEPRPRAVVGG